MREAADHDPKLTSPAPGGAAGGGQAGTDGTRQGAGNLTDGSRGGAGSSAGRVRARRPRTSARRRSWPTSTSSSTGPTSASRTQVLDANAGWLKEHADQLLVIEGHCDERGTSEYNTALGDRRARATKNYLVSRGVPATRITVISYGEERPACTQHADECWAQNRRAHFLVKAR